VEYRKSCDRTNFYKRCRPGNILKEEILQIDIRDFAVMCLEHGSGALGEFIEGQETSIYPIREGNTNLHSKI